MRGRDGDETRALSPARAGGNPVDATRLCRPLPSGKPNRLRTGPQGSAREQDPEATRLYRSGALTALLETERPKPRQVRQARQVSSGPSGLPPTVIGDLDRVEVVEEPIAIEPRRPARRPTSRARLRSSVVLLGLSLATLCFLFWILVGERGQTPQMRPARPQAGPPRSEDDGSGSVTTSGEGKTPPATGKRAEPTGEEPPVEPADDDRDVGGEERETGGEEKAAVALLLQGRYADALASYETLADRYPGQPVYGTVARLLRRRIAERCSQHPASMEEQCDGSR